MTNRRLIDIVLTPNIPDQWMRLPAGSEPVSLLGTSDEPMLRCWVALADDPEALVVTERWRIWASPVGDVQPAPEAGRECIRLGSIVIGTSQITADVFCDLPTPQVQPPAAAMVPNQPKKKKPR